MAKFCPNCGAEVKEGFKFCLSCGAQLEAGAPAAQQQQPIPPPQQPIYQQPYAPMQPKKSSSKMLFLIIALIAIIVVVVVVVVVLMGGVGGSQSFVGTWTATDFIGSTSTWTFSEDGTLERDLYGYPTVITWKLENNRLVIDEYGSETYTYEFRDGGNTLLLKMSYSGIEMTYYTLTKS